MEYEYFGQESRENLEKLQLKRLQNMVDYCFQHIPFYTERLSKAGITSGKQIVSLSDIQKIPFTTKEDLAQLYPYGALAIEPSEIVEIHESSGSTGVPKTTAYSHNDRKNWGMAVARLLQFCGITKNDILQNATPYGMFTGGVGCHYAAMHLGCTLMSASGGNTEQQLKLIGYYGTTAVTCTSSYALRLAEEFCQNPDKYNVDTLKKMWVGAEPCTDSMRKKIETALGCDIYNSYGLTEVWGPGFSGECVCKNGLHINEDLFYPEIILPETGKNASVGEVGEMVVTALVAEAMPVLRYRTNDLTRMIPGNCECGNIFRRVEPPRARMDDMIVLRGVNVYPFQIQQVLTHFPQISDRYVIELHRVQGRDTALLKAEYCQGNVETSSCVGLNGRVADALYAELNIHIDVEMVPFGTLFRELTKMKRIMDFRYG